MKNATLKILTLSVVTLAQSISFAQGYALTGATCASMGQWTRNALAQTQVIRNYINQLKDLKECKGIESIVPLIDSASASLAANPMSSETQAQAEALPGELNQLVGTVDSVGAGAKSDLLQAMLKTNVSSSILSVGKGQALLSAIAPATHATSAALAEISNMLPTYQNCLLGHKPQGGAMLAAIISLTASTAGSGGGVLSDFGQSLNNILTMMTNNKFAVPLRQLARVEFMNAVSCLLETSTEAYCSVSDVKHMYATGRLDSNFKYDGKNLKYNSPVQGSYILTQHLDNVIQWIQEVQLGVDPKWPSDAQMKAETIDNTYGYQKMAWQMQSKFAAAKFNFKNTAKDDISKKNTVFNILSDVVNPIAGGDPFSATPQAAGNWAQFITNTINPTLIPFYLIGRNEIPIEVAQNQVGRQAMTWDAYMRGKGDFATVPEFSDPTALLNTIEARLNELLRAGQTKANDYFRSRLIVNKPNLVVKSLVPMTNSVHFSFEMINEYIDSPITRILASGNSITDRDAKKAIGQMRVTQYKIKTVLAAYDKLDELKSASVNSDEDAAKVDKYYEDVVNTVFDQFDIVRQRDAYLMTAITNYVNLDYLLRARSGENLGRYEQDLVTISSRNLTQLVSSAHGMDPSALLADVAGATNINATNINTIESVFADSFYGFMDELNLIITGGDVSDHGMNSAAFKRLRDDVFFNGIAVRDNPKLYALSWALPVLGPIAMRYALKPDQYRLYLSAQSTIREQQDTSTGDREFLLAKLCIQSLAFVNRNDFARICGKFNNGQGVVLRSPYQVNDPNFDLNVSYNQILAAPRSKNHNDISNKNFRETTLCTYRDWLRRHKAYYLTQDIKKKNN